MKVGDVVVVIDTPTPRGHWPIGRIVEIFPGPDGHVRAVNVKVNDHIYKRSVHNLSYLTS